MTFSARGRLTRRSTRSSTRRSGGRRGRPSPTPQSVSRRSLSVSAPAQSLMPFAYGHAVALKSPNQVRGLLERARGRRAVAATLMNERSSRSHSVFSLRVSGNNPLTGESCEVSPPRCGSIAFHPSRAGSLICCYVRGHPLGCAQPGRSRWFRATCVEWCGGQQGPTQGDDQHQQESLGPRGRHWRARVGSRRIGSSRPLPKLVRLSLLVSLLWLLVCVASLTDSRSLSLYGISGNLPTSSRRRSPARCVVASPITPPPPSLGRLIHPPLMFLV